MMTVIDYEPFVEEEEEMDDEDSSAEFAEGFSFDSKQEREEKDEAILRTCRDFGEDFYKEVEAMALLKRGFLSLMVKDFPHSDEEREAFKEAASEARKAGDLNPLRELYADYGLCIGYDFVERMTRIAAKSGIELDSEKVDGMACLVLAEYERRAFYDRDKAIEELARKLERLTRKK